MQVDADDAVRSPDGILEPVEVPQAITHFVGRRPESDAVPGAAERQQVAVAVRRLVEERACARLVVHVPSRSPAMSSNGDVMARSPSAPQACRDPPNGEIATTALTSATRSGLARCAAARIGRQEATRNHFDEGTFRIQLAARRREHAVSAHRVADQRDARRIDAAFVGERALQGLRDERDVERAAKQQLRELAAVRDRRIRMADRRDDVAFRREVFREPAERHGFVAVAVRHDDQGKSSRGGLRVAHGDAGNREACRRRRRLGGKASRIRFGRLRPPRRRRDTRDRP